MAFFRRLWAKKPEEDYETILSNLANDVQKRQVKLSEIRLRERRSTLLVTIYTLAVWALYVSLWYMQALPGLNGHLGTKNAQVEKFVKGVPVAVGPIVALFIRRIVQIWYDRKGNAEEKQLQRLMKERRDKVEEIKKKTNYYTTRDLLQKYDETSSGNPGETPLRKRNGGPVPPNTPFTPRQPQPQQQQGPRAPLAIDPRLRTPASKPPVDPRLTGLFRASEPHAASSNMFTSAITPSYQVVPPRKQWYDKVADAILGDDDSSFQSPSSRYALICEKCFMHNGLVKESMWEEAQYVCPKCGHFNASVRSKKARQTGISPSTPVGISRLPSHSPSPSALSRSSRSSPPTSDRDAPTVDNDVTNMEVDE
ncbi:hypothetical protein BKA70DRAFT_1201672 [Coprinopsis sp. MPI-PUGE-AT-0042]|nr:hypothetical protein BKA70DRAFT_1201672 [Coprinopsis sp. MPI-PUGE-AT-0042]